MWRKAEDSKLESSSGASPSSVSAAQHPLNTPPAVSQGIKIKGDVSGHGDLSLDGEFEGNIRIDSGTVTVGPNARVRAGIEATEIIIRGQVIGTLKASERVHIWETGNLMGDVETNAIVIDDGAALLGTVSVNKKGHPSQPASPEPPPRAKGASA